MELSPLEQTIKIESSEQIEAGQWFWVNRRKYDECSEETDNPVVGVWLGCVSHIGSNFVEVTGPSDSNGRHITRVLFKDAHEELRLEGNSEQVIKDKIRLYQNKVTGYLGDLKLITSRLGVSKSEGIEDKSQSGDNSLMVLSGSTDIAQYKRDLIQAKEIDIPALIKEIAQANKKLKKWMSAEILPYESMQRGLSDNVDVIEDRIFNVSLYAGLAENIVQCSDGAPADYGEKLHVLQRRTYCDEECLLDYKHGGMEFNDIGKFDDWLVKEENRNRILPFPRCIVAMRVRRKRKDREDSPGLANTLIKLDLEDADTITFLYIRNGENVHRLNCDLDFGELIFPDKAVFDPDEPMMAKVFCGRLDKMMTVREYDSLLEEYEAHKKRSDQWELDNPDDHWMHNPHRNRSGIRPSDWSRFDEDNIYYDECVSEIDRQIKQYNRIALIIQGLFDRSEVLHPHAPVKSWTADGFGQAIELVYDGSNVLHYGEAPDFEAYRAKCNAKLNSESVVIGQNDFWQLKEAAKECDRLDNDYRLREYDHRPVRFKPEGNDGPGYISRMTKWQSKVRKAVFSWNREKLTGWDSGSPIRTVVTVPEEALFNISAYRPGDYLQFFRDPRTRAEYIKWAPMLMAAEEFHAGNLEVAHPV